MFSTAETLGRLAAQCELKAAARDLDEWQRLNLHRQAETYRANQMAEMETRTRQPYPLANVLVKRPLVERIAHWILAASIVALALLIVY